jgi:ureidoglycolate dehydrogenase (NAD+)
MGIEQRVAGRDLKDITHQGAMAYYSLIAAHANKIGLALVCSPPNMAPHGARSAGVHNSPITIAVPARRHGPLVLDMATSVAAGGKLRLAVDKRQTIPIGWGLDNQGRPTTDPKLATTLLPLGGPKGAGLAIMFECLSSLVAENPLFDPPESASENALFKVRDFRQNGVVAAIDVSALISIDQYKDEVDSYIDGLKRLPKAEGVHEILVPGEFENMVAEERANKGIPLPEGTIQNLELVANRFGVTMPAPISCSAI